MSDPASAAKPAPLRRLLRVASIAALVLLPLVGVAAMLALQAPRWWKPVARGDAAAADRAAAFEQSVVSEFTRVRPDAPEWAVRIRESEVNDWLGTRLPVWLESRGETAPIAVQARFTPGVVRVGTDLRRVVAWWQGCPQPFEGGLRLASPGGGVGRLPVPLVGVGLDRVLDRQALAAPIRLADGRRVRLLDLEVLDGEVRLRLRTEPSERGFRPSEPGAAASAGEMP